MIRMAFAFVAGGITAIVTMITALEHAARDLERCPRCGGVLVGRERHPVVVLRARDWRPLAGDGDWVTLMRVDER